MNLDCGILIKIEKIKFNKTMTVSYLSSTLTQDGILLAI